MGWAGLNMAERWLISLLIIGLYVLRNDFVSASPLAQLAAPWSIDAYGLQLQPSFGGDGLGYSSYSNYSGRNINNVFVGTNLASNNIYNVHPKWSWGLGLGGRYRLSHEKDVRINWYHLGAGVDRYLPTNTIFSGSLAGLFAGRIQLNTTWNSLQFELERRFHFVQDTEAYIHGGLAVAKISNQFIAYPQRFASSGPVFVTTDQMSYSGFGPRVGGDLAYQTRYGPRLYMVIASSLLVGSATQTTSGFSDVARLVRRAAPYSVGNYNQSSSGVVVPEIDAKMGTTYDIHFGPRVVHFDVGYLWINYLHAIVHYSGIGVVGNSVGTYHTSNFELNGLYLGVHGSFDDVSPRV